mgnify:CR=1 FL=1
MKKRVCFMGTPEFAVAILDALVQSDVEVVAVVSQPDKKVGRKQILQATPVKERALSYNILVLQPEKIKDSTNELKELNLDLIVTCAYGQFIPETILNTPKYGSVNIHASLLPKHRGGAPIHKAIINGEDETGITIMRMVKKMDAGDIIFQQTCPIYEEDDFGSLHDRLQDLGSNMIKEYLSQLFTIDLQTIPQDESKVSFSYNISSEEEFVNFNDTMKNVYNKIRGLNPWPVSHSIIEHKKVKLFKAIKSDIISDGEVGTVIGLINEGLAIKVQDGVILIKELQVEGKNRMTAQAFYQGMGKQWVNLKFDTYES